MRIIDITRAARDYVRTVFNADTLDKHYESLGQEACAVVHATTKLSETEFRKLLLTHFKLVQKLKTRFGVCDRFNNSQGHHLQVWIHTEENTTKIVFRFYKLPLFN